MRIDRSDGDDGPAPAPDVSDVPVPRRPPDTVGALDAGVPSEDAPDASGQGGTRDRPETPEASTERQVRVDRVVEHRATVDAAYRAYAIDQAYEKISEIERGTVTPAMRRIEAEDPDRHLAGLENRLKGKDRLSEKVSADSTL